MATPSLTISNSVTGKVTSVDLRKTATNVDGTSVFVLSPGNVRVTIGSTMPQTLEFEGMSSVLASNYFSQVRITADSGNNTFRSMGESAVTDVEGGPGRNIYQYYAGALVIEDYKVGTDRISLPLYLARAQTIGSDGNGGTMLTFGSAGSGFIDVVGVDPAIFRN